jgi:hypothetical protein
MASFVLILSTVRDACAFVIDECTDSMINFSFLMNKHSYMLNFLKSMYKMGAY